MRHGPSLVLLGALVAALLLVVAPAAFADWPHEAKWDQLDPCSVWIWQSYVNEEDNYIVADDFRCDETGWITDIEFYGYTDNLDALSEFRITFWTDMPACAEDASHPDVLRKEILVSEASPNDQDHLGWQVLVQSVDTILFKINLPRDDWFKQNEGNIYWIGIQGIMAGEPGFYWKFRDDAFPTWGDDAASMGIAAPVDEWANLAWTQVLGMTAPTAYHGTLPVGYQSADMAFKLTGTAVPEPATCALVVAGAALVAALRRRSKT
jgi:hypothetical protein